MKPLSIDDLEALELFAPKWRGLSRERRASVYEFMILTAHASRITAILVEWCQEHYRDGLLVPAGTDN